MAEEKPNPRPKIDYPPFETKEWVPPDQRPKKKRKPRYVKPDGITQKLEVSCLQKIWNKFRVYGDRQLLLGSFSETHRRFRVRSNGYQTPCNCIVAIVYSQFIPMKKWDYYILDTILYMGNDLYMSTIHHQSNRAKTDLLLCEVYPSFYYGDTKVTVTMKGNKHCGKLFEDIDTSPFLAGVVVKFFEEHASGILTVGKRHMALWTAGRTYYLFDPTEHDWKGHPWRGVRGLGYACVMRFKDTNDLVDVVHENFGARENLKFVITPCSIIRLVKIAMQPPQNVIKEHCLQELPEFEVEKVRQLPSRDKIADDPLEEEKEIVSVSPDEEFADEAMPTTNNELDINEEYASDVGRLTMSPSEYARKGVPLPSVLNRTAISDSKIPCQKPRAESVTYFASVVHDKIGILRASTHQCDTRYTLQKGKQSVANAIMALTMLRLYKSREWFRKIIDDVLKFGERYYGDAIKQLPTGTPLKVSNVPQRIGLYDLEFMPEVDEYTTIGRLQSTKTSVLDLLPALQEFFRNSQSCVITGPLTVAAWFEDKLFYMFDPNERDPKGQVVIKTIQIGSEIQVLDYIPGVACVTWYTDLRLLVDLYMNNIEPALRREPFLLSKIVIKDFEYKPDDWYNFEGVSQIKWILRGTFNQNDRRFHKDVRNTQCTAAAAIALAMAHLKPIKRWKTSDVDEVLIASEDFYIATVKSLKSRNLYCDPKLLVDELLRKYTVEGNEITFDITDCLVNGLIEGDEEEPVFDLPKGIGHFFKENDYGILSCREISVAIWKKDQVYYYYDSHSRNEDGLLNNYGTACVLRLLTVDDLARTLVANFEPGTNNMFNISSVRFIVWQNEGGGIVRPPLHNYKEVDLYTSILRAISSDRSPRFKLNAGKQAIPMCLAAVAMMKVYPSCIWSVDIMEEILTVGDQLFTDTMVERERQENLPPQNDIDEVYAENCLQEFKIGTNKFTMNYGNAIAGNFEEHFKNKMAHFFSTRPANFNDEKELFVTSNFYNVMTWYDGNVYYLFDPKPRDERGQIYGKDEWSAKMEPEPEAEGEGEDNDLEHLQEAAIEKLGGDGDNADEKKSQMEEPGVAVKHSPSYWRAQEDNGLACTLWFVSYEKLIEHIYESTPPNRREDLKFKLYPISVINKPELKKCYDPSVSAREDNYAGDWYDFKEIDYGRWILRGLFCNAYIMFPEHNRGKQQLPMCYAAIGYAKRFAVSRFNTNTVNDILKYGDRLYSATRKTRMDELKNNKNLGLSGAEIEEILNHQHYGVRDSIRAFCIGLDQIQIQIVENVYSGDLNGKTPEILDVPRAVKEFFDNYKYGILLCRNLVVALWRGVNVFYMFDSNSNGPCGIVCPSGEACITRYLNINAMTDVFSKNLDKEGKSSFAIHLVKIRIVPCPRPLKPEEKVTKPEPPKYTGITGVMPGKCILRGTLSQEHETFGRGRNVQSAAVAVVALSMSLVHKPYTWTMPIVDDVLYLGDELYGATIEKLNYEYNPWEHGLTVSLVNKDYRVGSLRANFEVRPADQRGVIDIKHPKIPNLRQGIERFFEENTYGVIETDPLTVAVWEEEEQPGFIYMYDPNPRGPGGLYLEGGTACLLIFETSKLAADHFLANVTDTAKRTGEFVITPVEIVVGNVATKARMAKKKKHRCKNDPVDLNKREPTTLCDRKNLRKMAEQERKKKEQLRLSKIGKNDYFVMSNGDAILRGTKSQSSRQYSEHSRGYQDIPNCFAAFVVHRLSPVSTWHFKHVDMILDVGDQLYKDSYVTYNPKNPKLGMANVLRKVFIKEVQVTLQVYKPVMSNVLTAYNLELALINYFQQEQFGILSAMKEHVALFFKEGYYYLFDPHDRDVDGNKIDDGVACVVKFKTISNLVAKYLGNTSSDCEFTITLVTVGSIVKKGEKASCCLPKVK